MVGCGDDDGGAAPVLGASAIGVADEPIASSYGFVRFPKATDLSPRGTAEEERAKIPGGSLLRLWPGRRAGCTYVRWLGRA